MKIAPISTPMGNTLFCDDVRYETNGKQTLVGVYAGDMVFSAEATFPIILPKLCMRISYSERPQESTDPIQVRVYMPGDPDDAPTYKMDIEREQLQAIPVPPPDPDSEPFLMYLQFSIESHNVSIKQEGKIRVRAYRGDLEVRMGSLRVAKGTPGMILGVTPNLTATNSSQQPPQS